MLLWLLLLLLLLYCEPRCDQVRELQAEVQRLSIQLQTSEVSGRKLQRENGQLQDQNGQLQDQISTEPSDQATLEERAGCHQCSVLSAQCSLCSLS